MFFKDKLAEKIHLYDGSKGFLIMQRGLEPGDCPDAWNLSRPDDVYDIHKAYVDAGSEVIQTNTLQSSRYHLEARGLYEKLNEINRAGVALAKKAAGGKALTAASISPLGVLMAPYGDLVYEDAYNAFSEQISALLDAGVDILHFETFTDLSELRVAVTAAKELSRRTPVIATVSVDNGGRTVMGDAADCTAAALAALGADCAGANCGLPPRELLSKFAPFSAFNAPLCSKPNAGAPSIVDGAVNYGATAEEFYETAFGFARLGARLIGGCCGSGPDHIRMLKTAVDAMNADRAYDYANINAGAAPANGNITLYSHAKKAVFPREALVAYVKEAYGEAAAKNHGAADSPGYYESADGKLLTVDLSFLIDNNAAGRKYTKDMYSDIIVDALAEAGGYDAEATVFGAFTVRGGAGSAPGRADGKSGGKSGGKSCGIPTGEDAETVFGLIAENARAYHNKPLIFYTDAVSALRGAVKRYCGVPAVIIEKSEEENARKTVSDLGPVIIGI